MDGEGLEGVDRYESYLRGEKRMMVLQRDALGRTVFQGNDGTESDTGKTSRLRSMR